MSRLRLVPLGLLLASSLAHAERLPEPLPVKDVTATSTLAETPHDKVANRYAPWRVIEPQRWTDPKSHAEDGSATHTLTAWCEGKPDAGIGESLTITFTKPVVVPAVAVAAGVWNSDELFEGNNRPKTLEVLTSDGRKLTMHPNTESRWNWETVDVGGKPITSVTIKIVAVEAGKMNDTCLTEVTLGVPTVRGMAPAALTALPDAIPAAADALGTCDADALKPIVSFPFEWRAPDKPRKLASLAALKKACDDGAFKAQGYGETHYDYTQVTAERVVVMDQSGPHELVFVWKGGHWLLGGLNDGPF
jgi:hypothetical protein